MPEYQREHAVSFDRHDGPRYTYVLRIHEEERANAWRENGTRECNLRLLKCQRFLHPDRKCLLTAVAGTRFYTAGFRFAEIRLFGKPIMRVKMFVSPRGGAKEAAGFRYERSVRHTSSGLRIASHR